MTEQQTSTPIDPADIRPGDVVERRRRYVVQGRGPDHGIDARCEDTNTHEVLNPAVGTWRLVHRPDPDAEVIDALILSASTDSSGEPDYGRTTPEKILARLRERGWDVVRRAES